MKKFILVPLVCMSTQVLAEKPLPVGITPITEPFVLRYQPHHIVTCVENKSEKEAGAFFSKNSTETTAMEVFSDGDSVKVGMRMEVQGGGFLRFVFDANEDRTGVAAGEPEFQTNLTLSEKDKDDLVQVKALFSRMMEKASEVGVMGKQIAQDYQLSQDVCSVFGATALSTDGDIRAIGTGQIKGRRSVIFKQDMSSTCSVSGGELSFRTTGWSAYDVESGLPVDSTGTGEVTVSGKSASFTSDKECTVKGEIKAPTPVARRADQRLTELKVLLDKGLISKDEYDKKRSEILDAL